MPTLSWSLVLPVLLGVLLSKSLDVFWKPKPAVIMFDVVAMFGDSITQQAWGPNGVGAALANAYQRKFDVLNRGLSGYNTAWAIPIAKKWLPLSSTIGRTTPTIRLLLIWFGANDSAIAPSPQGITIEEFKSNLHMIIRLVADPASPSYSPLTKFLLLTPPPVDADHRNAELHSRVPPRVPDRDSERTKLFAEAVKEVGVEANVPCVDTWTAIMKAAEEDGGLDRYLSDGLHLSPDGYGVVTNEVTKAIELYLPELHWDKLEQTFPHWTDVINKGALGEQFRAPEQKQN